MTTLTGSYAIARPFNIATKDKKSEVTQDFINYILSEDGQKVIESNGYIKASDAGAFKSNGAKGKIVVAGSSSVTPVMEKLAESYKTVNSGAEIEIQESDSTTGMNSAAEGTCDIGMASRDLKDSETGAGLTPTVIAKDGIVVIVNNENKVDNMTKAQVNDVSAEQSQTGVPSNKGGSHERKGNESSVSDCRLCFDSRCSINLYLSLRQWYPGN